MFEALALLSQVTLTQRPSLASESASSIATRSGFFFFPSWLNGGSNPESWIWATNVGVSIGFPEMLVIGGRIGVCGRLRGIAW